MKPNAQDPPQPRGGVRRGAYSAIELIVVLSVLGLILALAAPGLIALGPSGKTGLHQLAGFLERARAEAMASGEERYVAFADESFPLRGEALRAYALFARAPGRDDGPHSPALQRLTPWKTLPKGLYFARGEAFATEDGAPFRTLHDLAPTLSFPLPDSSSGFEETTGPLPGLAFGPDGSLHHPDFVDADALHLGLVLGHFDPGTAQLQIHDHSPRECLALGHCTGRIHLLTD